VKHILPQDESLDLIPFLRQKLPRHTLSDLLTRRGSGAPYYVYVHGERGSSHMCVVRRCACAMAEDVNLNDQHSMWGFLQGPARVGQVLQQIDVCGRCVLRLAASGSGLGSVHWQGRDCSTPSSSSSSSSSSLRFPLPTGTDLNASTTGRAGGAQQGVGREGVHHSAAQRLLERLRRVRGWPCIGRVCRHKHNFATLLASGSVGPPHAAGQEEEGENNEICCQAFSRKIRTFSRKANSKNIKEDEARI